MRSVVFDAMQGETFTKVYQGEQDDNDAIFFEKADGSVYVMYHRQDCCESVYVESIVGDLNDLAGSEILTAEESSTDGSPEEDGDETSTWTFYKLSTLKGYVDIRWYGSSNGYYSETVELYKKSSQPYEWDGLDLYSEAHNNYIARVVHRDDKFYYYYTNNLMYGAGNTAVTPLTNVKNIEEAKATVLALVRTS